MTGVTLGSSGYWLGTRKEAGGAVTQAKDFFFGRSPWLMADKKKPSLEAGHGSRGAAIPGSKLFI